MITNYNCHNHNYTPLTGVTAYGIHFFQTRSRDHGELHELASWHGVISPWILPGLTHAMIANSVVWPMRGAESAELW